MPLIKSIAARIDAEAASGVPQKTLRMNLICTFRYESELYSYGDFLHQITHDVRFTSWLKTSIHVSRAEKNPRVITSSNNSNSIIDTKTQTGQNSQCHNGDNIPPTSPVESITTVAQEEKPQLLGDTKSVPITFGKILVDDQQQQYPDRAFGKILVDDQRQRYQGRVLPTFLAADSARVSTIHAVRDLLITAAILLIPFAAYIGVRYAPIEGFGEGKWNWCRTTRIYDQNMTNKCMWNYTMTPGVVQIGVASIIGYALIYLGRRATSREAYAAKAAADDGATSGNTRAYLESVLRAQIMEYDGTISFKPSRLDVEKYIVDLMAEGVGMGKTKAVKADSGKKEMVGKTTTVFVGGPDGFLDTVEKANRKAKWSVEFHRETWSP